MLGPEGVDCEIPRRFERGTSANENIESQMRVDSEIPYQLRRRTKHSL